METKRSVNESTANVTYERLASSLRSQADKLRAAHPNRRVDYEVIVKDGKTLLKPILR
ncbi:MAG: MXAN_5187 C-terminal domain-containing protein [Polyangiaceae bacterium]